MQLEQFFANYPAQSKEEQDRYDQMLRVVDANIRWQTKNYPEVSEWLDNVVPSQVNSILQFKSHSSAKSSANMLKRLS